MLTCPACGRANPAEASFCMGCGGPLGATATAHETRKTVTALFCDLVGSTTLVETHDPEVLRPLLDRYFAAMRETAEHHGGRVEKFIGDAVSAVFGLPAAHEDDALRAVRAGVEMQARLAHLNAGASIPLVARIGITTGEVLVPGGGAAIIGDAINTASRLQSSAEPGSVVIGEPTWRLVRDAVVTEPVEPLQLKGKVEPVPAYRVVTVASLSPMRTRRLVAPMVGRKRETALLEDAFERVASDRACALFTVLGSAGAGKSRLVEEFLGARADGDAEILRGRCLPYGESITWFAVTEALRGALGLPEFADADAIRAAIHKAVDGEEHAPALEADLASLFALGSVGSAEETAWAIRQLLESWGRDRPLVLVLDDIHWGEPAFLDFVEHLADWSRDTSILLLCMARPDLLDVRPTWGGGRTNATTISLAPLSGAETDALIDGLLGSSALPPEIKVRITQVAEGNPLFVEEMLRMLVDDGRLVRDEEGWVAAGDLADVAVPPTVSALLSARLDRLAEDERRVIEAGSVAGKEFHRGAVAALLPRPARPELAVHLRSLIRKELITPERSSLPGEDAYRFRHLLIRDAAYDAIPKSARSELHRAFADWLEGVAADRVAEQQELLGYHLERAYLYRTELGLPEDRELRLRAARALGAAGTRALDDGDFGTAIRVLRPAAELASGDRAELEILDDLAVAMANSAGFTASHAIVARLAAASEAADDPVYAMRVRHLQDTSRFFTNPGDWDAKRSSELMDEATRVYRSVGAAGFVASSLSWQAVAESALGSDLRAASLAEAALEAAIQAGDRRMIRRSLIRLIESLTTGPTPLSETLAGANGYLARFGNDLTMELALTEQRARVHAWMGRRGDAVADVVRSREIATQLGRDKEAGNDTAYFLCVERDAAWSEGDLPVAEARARRALGIFATAGNQGNFEEEAPSLVRILLDLGRLREAETVFGQLDQSRTLLWTRIRMASVGALVAAHQGRQDDALQLVATAERLALATDFAIDQGDVALDRAKVLLLGGRPETARASVSDAIERYEIKEYAVGLSRTRTFIAALPG